MTAAPTVAPAERQPEARPALLSPPRPRRALPWSWVRLVGLLLVAVASELVYVAFWPLCYYLTQGVDYTYAYLVQYPAVWERLLPLLLRFEATWPEGARSLEFMVDAFMRTFVGAFVLYLLGFLLIRAGLPRGWGTVVVVASAVAFQTTLFLMPGLFTTDLFSYAIYGQIAGPYELNPYVHLPAYFPQNPIMHWIHPIWHYAPAIYGPAWIDLSWALAHGVSTWADADKVLAYKVVVNLAQLGAIGALALAVHRLRPGQTLASVQLYAWNPLILFEFGGNGHNDAVMVALMLLGLALFAWGGRWIGLVALIISFLIKMSSILVLPYYVIAWARRRGSLTGFALVLAISGVTVVGVVALLYLPWWVGLETIGPILTWSQGPMFINYVPDILSYRVATEYLPDPIAPDPAAELEWARGWTRLVTRALFAAYCLWELVRVRDPLGVAAAGARVMLAFLLIGNTWNLPWYFTWPLALAIVVGPRSRTAIVLIGFSVSAPLVMYYNHFWSPYTPQEAYVLYLAPLALGVLAGLPGLVARTLRASDRRSPARVEGS